MTVRARYRWPYADRLHCVIDVSATNTGAVCTGSRGDSFRTREVIRTNNAFGVLTGRAHSHLARSGHDALVVTWKSPAGIHNDTRRPYILAPPALRKENCALQKGNVRQAWCSPASVGPALDTERHLPRQP